MKNFFRRATILTLGMGLALTFTACHHPGDEDNTQIVVGNVTNTLRGLIFDQDGAALSGATVTINGNSTAVTGNEFGPRTGLADGTYTVVVKKNGYKDVVKDVTLAATIENGQKYGQDAVESFYLALNTLATETRLPLKLHVRTMVLVRLSVILRMLKMNL